MNFRFKDYNLLTNRIHKVHNMKRKLRNLQKICFSISQVISEASSEPNQTSKMDLLQYYSKAFTSKVIIKPLNKWV